MPGLTRAAIPILARLGVKALTVGVNGVSAPPAVPFNTPFWWRDGPSGAQLLSFWHPGEWGGGLPACWLGLPLGRHALGLRRQVTQPEMPSTLPPCLLRCRSRPATLPMTSVPRLGPEGGYSGEPVDSRDECVHAPGSRTRLCLSWTQDNKGPPSAAQVLAIFKQVGSREAAAWAPRTGWLGATPARACWQRALPQTEQPPQRIAAPVLPSVQVRRQFPGARVVASSLDEYVREVLAKAHQLDLPVVRPVHLVAPLQS